MKNGLIETRFLFAWSRSASREAVVASILAPSIGCSNTHPADGPARRTGRSLCARRRRRWRFPPSLLRRCDAEALSRDPTIQRGNADENQLLFLTQERSLRRTPCG